MRIGVFTHWKSTANYGQVLQGFALQRALIRMGFYSEIVRYELKNSWKRKICSVVKNPLRLFAVFIRVVQYRFCRLSDSSPIIAVDGGNRGFEEFKKQYIKYSAKKYYGLYELEKYLSGYDALIVGSDQVWNYHALDENSRAWYLDFKASVKLRMSYAASFGRSVLTSQEAEYFRKHSARLNHISVREESGLKLCEMCGRHDALAVLDPTLLLNILDYEELASEAKNITSDDYIFVYCLSSGGILPFDQIREWSEEKDSRLLCTYGDTIGEHKEENYYPSISEWLMSIKNAKYIITNSFHGAVFSVLYHKNFIVYIKNDIEGNTNDRMLSFLRLLGLEKRAVKQGNNIDEAFRQETDWNRVDELLLLSRNKSIQFLQKLQTIN